MPVYSGFLGNLIKFEGKLSFPSGVLVVNKCGLSQAKYSQDTWVDSKAKGVSSSCIILSLPIFMKIGHVRRTYIGNVVRA
jgi:hypothetical protein